jgi:serine/threonine protein kinase
MDGTLPYISPEQTGRMNSGLNYRSEFYSRGVPFCELLKNKGYIQLILPEIDRMESIIREFLSLANPYQKVKCRVRNPFSSMKPSRMEER